MLKHITCMLSVILLTLPAPAQVDTVLPKLYGPFDFNRQNIYITGSLKNLEVDELYADNLCTVRNGSMYGVYDFVQQLWVIPPVHNKIGRKSPDTYFTCIGTSAAGSYTALYFSSGKQLFRIEGQHYLPPWRPYETGQWMMKGPRMPPVVDDSGKIIVADTFAYADLLISKGRKYYDAITKDHNHALIDLSGKIILPAEYSYISFIVWGQDYMVAVRDGKWCLVSPEGKVLTDYKYANIFSGEKRVITARLHARVEYSDPEENPVRSWFVAKQADNDLYGVLDSMGNLVITCQYDEIKQVYMSKLVVANKNGKWGTISMDNKPLSKFIYDEIDVFYYNYTTFKRKNIKGTLLDNGKEYGE